VGYRVLGTLTGKPYGTSQWTSRSYVPTWRAWQRLQQPWMETTQATPDPDRQYKGRVVVLTSAQTYSAAEDFVSAFKTMKRGVVIGEPTGGSTGQPLMIPLPGGGMARICTKRDMLTDGTEFIGKGIAVDVAVNETVDAVRAGRDEVLEAALAWLKKALR
jgi:C-terminal processing protease CtpA/Prc